VSIRRLAAVLRSSRERDDAGVSLIELIVVMALSLIILMIVGTLFVNVSVKTTESIDVRGSTADASNIMNAVSTTVRGSVTVPVAPKADGTPNAPLAAVKTASANSLVVYSYTDAGPSFPVPLQVRYSVNAQGRMVEDRWAATGCTLSNPTACTATYPTYKATSAAPDATRILGNVVVNVTQCAVGDTTCQLEPLFRYYDICENQLGTDKDGAQANIADIAWIEFNVRVRASGSQEDVRLVNRIGLGNTGNRIPVGGCSP
jgi:prepilin-type N-terminal cleavage/methylation domain-containing protein